MADEKEKEELPKTKVVVFSDGEEIFSKEVENATGVTVQGAAGGVSLPFMPDGGTPVNVYVTTVQNPTPVRPETSEEKKAREQAEKDAADALKQASGPGPVKQPEPEPVPSKK